MFNKSSNRRSKCSSKPCQPSLYDVMCGKDKTHAKHEGNRLFKEKIEETKVAYVEASTKQARMVITKEVVTYMQAKYGSRFLKMVGGNWVEINQQAARDKVSHALRFAARNLKKSDVSPTRTVQPATGAQNKTTFDSDESVTSSNTESDQEEIAPLFRIFDQTFVNNSVPTMSPRDAFMAQQQMNHLDFASTKVAATNEDEDIALSFRSMELDDVADAALRRAEAMPNHIASQQQQQQQTGMEPEFNTLRSEDLNAIMDEPLGEEWDEVEQLARC